MERGKNMLWIRIRMHAHLDHGVDVEVGVFRMTCSGCADRKTTLSIEGFNEAREGTVRAFQPIVDSVVMTDGQAMIGWRELNSDRDVREKDIERAEGRDLAKDRIRIVHQTAPIVDE